MRKAFLLLLTTIIFTGCASGPVTVFDTGYQDGFSVGYNRNCNLPINSFQGVWESQEYTTGYRDGYAAGTNQCALDAD